LGTVLIQFSSSPAALMDLRSSSGVRRLLAADDFFAHSRILVSTSELFALWRAIAEVSKDPSIGLKLATGSRIERFHPMGIAALSTESFGAAIKHMAPIQEAVCVGRNPAWARR